jgi:hypothetical protein
VGFGWAGVCRGGGMGVSGWWWGLVGLGCVGGGVVCGVDVWVAWCVGGVGFG